MLNCAKEFLCHQKIFVCHFVLMITIKVMIKMEIKFALKNNFFKLLGAILQILFSFHQTIVLIRKNAVHIF